MKTVRKNLRYEVLPSLWVQSGRTNNATFSGVALRFCLNFVHRKVIINDHNSAVRNKNLGKYYQHCFLPQFLFRTAELVVKLGAIMHKNQNGSNMEEITKFCYIINFAWNFLLGGFWRRWSKYNVRFQKF